MSVGYLIDPFLRQIRHIEYEPGDAFRAYLPNGLCIGWTYPNGDVLYVDDKGLLFPARAGFRIRERRDGQPMMSRGVLVGREEEFADGRYTVHPPKMTIEQAQAEFTLLDRETALDWFRARADEPAVSVDGRAIAHWADILRNLLGEPGGYYPGKPVETRGRPPR